MPEHALECLLQRHTVDRFDQQRRGSQPQRLLGIVNNRDDEDGDRARSRIGLQQAEHLPAIVARQQNVRHDDIRLHRRRTLDRRRAVRQHLDTRAELLQIARDLLGR